MSNNRLKTLNRDANRVTIKNMQETIFLTQWVNDVAGSGYWYYDISNGEITSSRGVTISFPVGSIENTTDILRTNESFDGYVRLYAKKQPPTDLQCSLKIEYGIS